MADSKRKLDYVLSYLVEHADTITKAADDLGIDVFDSVTSATRRALDKYSLENSNAHEPRRSE